MIPSKWKKLITSKKGSWVIFAVAVLGILLVYASSHWPVKQTQQVDTTEEYVSQLEEKLGKVVSRISGEKSPEVFVTLESTAENVYADSIDESNDISENTDGITTQKKQEKSNSKKEYILVEDANGDQTALLVTTLSPSIRGVVIVSEYADEPEVREAIVQAITTSLNLSTKKVCVVGVNHG